MSQRVIIWEDGSGQVHLPSPTGDSIDTLCGQRETNARSSRNDSINPAHHAAVNCAQCDAMAEAHV